MEQSDSLLLAQWATRRDSDAFMELVVRHSAMVYAACMRVLGNGADAEEVVQECFLELARAHGKIKKTHVGWLHSVAVKRSVLRIRGDARRRAREKAYGENQPSTLEPRWEDLQPELDACIAELPDPLRMAIVSRFLEGLTYEAASQRLGAPISTVQYRVQQGLEHLRKRLAKRGIVSSATVLAALLAANASEGAQVPAGLTASLGKLVLTSGATGAGTGVALATGGVLTMKTLIAAVASIAILAGLGLTAKTYFAHPTGQSPVALAQAGTSTAPEESVAISSKPAEDRTAQSKPAEVSKSQASVAAPPSTKPGSVSGVVIHEKTGEPVPGLVFTIVEYVGNSPRGNHERVGTATTDTEGRFTFDAPHETYYMMCLEDDTLALCKDVLIEPRLGGQPVEDLVIKVTPGASVSGRVYDQSSGEGIKGVKVTVPSDWWRSTKTDEEGEYRLGGLMARGARFLNLGDTGVYINPYATGRPGLPLELQPAEDKENVDIPLEKGIELRGLVVNEADIPLTEGHVSLYGDVLAEKKEGAGLGVWTNIGPDGRFVLTGLVPSERAMYKLLRVSGNTATMGFDAGPYWPYEESAGYVPLWADERRFVLQEAAQAQGRVLDAQTSQPIQTFDLYVSQGTCSHGSEDIWSGRAKAFQDPEGRFRCAVYRGTNTVFALADGYAPGLAHVEATTPGEAIEADVLLERGGVIEGTVTDGNGKGLQGATIIDDLVPEGKQYVKEAKALLRTDNFGRFRTTVKPGTRAFSAWAQDKGSARQTASVVAGESLRLYFVLNGGAVISGRITQDQRPIGAHIGYSILGEDGTRESGEVYTPNTGEFSIAGLPAGRGTLKIRTMSPSAKSQEAFLAVDTRNGKRVVADCDFSTTASAPAASISGNVRLNGEPMPDGTVVVYPEGQDEESVSATGSVANGTYEVAVVPDGRVVLAVTFMNRAEKRTYREVVEVGSGAAIQHDLDIRTDIGATIQGQVVQANSDHVLQYEFVALLTGTICVDDIRRKDYFVTTDLVAAIIPDQEARYRFEGIPDGEYTLVFSWLPETNDRSYTLANLTVRNGQSQTVDLEVK